MGDTGVRCISRESVVPGSPCPLGTVSVFTFGDDSERHFPHWESVRLSSEQAVLWVFLTPNQYTFESFWEARIA